MADVTADTVGLSERYHFLIRRLHSLSGIVPVGVFLCIHLSVNATIVAGPGAFQYAVDLIHAMDKLGILTAVEVLFIFLPIAFHAGVGIIIWLTSTPNVLAYPHGGNIRYTLQRWTGVATAAFILVHLWHMHWIGAWIPHPADFNPFDPHAAPGTAAGAIQYAWWYTPLYGLGVICAVYHFANGIWSFLITWGVTIGPKSQRISGYACVVFGVILGVFGLGSLIKLKFMDASTPAPVHEVSKHTVLDYHACEQPNWRTSCESWQRTVRS